MESAAVAAPWIACWGNELFAATPDGEPDYARPVEGELAAAARNVLPALLDIASCADEYVNRDGSHEAFARLAASLSKLDTAQ